MSRTTMLRERLESAVEIMEQAVPKVRQRSKAIAVEMEAEITAAREILEDEGAPGSAVFRIARVENVNTGRLVYVQVSKDGKLPPREAKALGVKKADSWRRIRAESWKEAREAFDKGEGARFPVKRQGSKKRRSKQS